MVHVFWVVCFCGAFWQVNICCARRSNAAAMCWQCGCGSARFWQLEGGLLVAVQLPVAPYESLTAALILWCREWMSGLALPPEMKHLVPAKPGVLKLTVGALG
jgi:hypothetical protein